MPGRRPMRRFSILGLMGVISACAVGAAALSNPTDLWDETVFSLTLLILVASTLVAIRRGGAALGFALFGSIYLIASLIPPIEARLLTTRGLAYIHPKVATGDADPVEIIVTSGGDHSSNGKVWLWDAVTGKPVRRMRDSGNFIRIG